MILQPVCNAVTYVYQCRGYIILHQFAVVCTYFKLSGHDCLISAPDPFTVVGGFISPLSVAAVNTVEIVVLDPKIFLHVKFGHLNVF